ncbi:MAG: helix-turn-helix transcriptional regulator [Terriglobia bacterium]
MDRKQNFRNEKHGTLLRTEEAALVLSVSPATLRWWRVKGHRGGPPFYKLHKSAVRYSRYDLMRWLRERRVGD